MPLHLAAYQPDIAANLGSMIRICACFDVHLHVISPCGFPFSVKALRRSAMDYADIAVVTHHDSWQDFRIAQADRRLVLLTTKGAVPHWDFAFGDSDTLIVGRESAGVPDDVAAAVDAGVAIPMPGGGRSLNVAVSAGIVLSEGMRQLHG